jgi:hypothetical protein
LAFPALANPFRADPSALGADVGGFCGCHDSKLPSTTDPRLEL